MQARDNIDFTFLSPTPRAEHRQTGTEGRSKSFVHAAACSSRRAGVAPPTAASSDSLATAWTSHTCVSGREAGRTRLQRVASFFMCHGRRRHHGLQLEQGCSDALAAVVQPQGAPDGAASQPCRGTRQRRPAGGKRRRSATNEQCPSKGVPGQNGSGTQGRSVQERRCAKRRGDDR